MNLEHIHPDFRHIMALSDQERIRFTLEDRWVDYPAAEKVLQVMKDLLDHPRSKRMPGLLIIADGYNGKSSVIERFINLHGQGYVNEEAEPVKPVICTQSKGADEKRLHISILERFVTPYRAGDDTRKLYYQVLHQCRACHVQVLVIDEIHDLLSGSKTLQRDIITSIKHLSTELRVPIVGAGTREAVQALHMTDQLSTRFDVMTLPLWQPNQFYQKLLAGFEKTLPLKHPSHLSKKALATAIYGIAGARIGDVRKFLQECVKQAIRSGQEQIDLDLVEKNKKWKRPSDGIRELIG